MFVKLAELAIGEARRQAHLIRLVSVVVIEELLFGEQGIILSSRAVDDRKHLIFVVSETRLHPEQDLFE